MQSACLDALPCLGTSSLSASVVGRAGQGWQGRAGDGGCAARAAVPPGRAEAVGSSGAGKPQAPAGALPAQCPALPSGAQPWALRGVGDQPGQICPMEREWMVFTRLMQSLCVLTCQELFQNKCTVPIFFSPCLNSDFHIRY